MPTARSLWFVAPGQVVLRSEALSPLHDGEVLVRTSFSGVSSGTERMAYRGELDPDVPVDETIASLGGTFRYPFRYGYSCVGVVEATRSPTLREGELVFAFQPHQDRFVVDAAEVTALGDLDPRTATLFPMVETALQISLDAGPVLADTVVVLGLGVVGALTSLMLQRAGAHVVAADPLRWRRDVVAALGVETVDPGKMRGVGPRGDLQVPLVIEATGNPKALRSALGLLAHEGTALVASWYGTKEVTLPLGQEFHRRRLTIRSTQVSTVPARLTDRWDAGRRRRTVVDLLDELPLVSLATNSYGFEQAADAYAAVEEAREGLMHVALCYA